MMRRNILLILLLVLSTLGGMNASAQSLDGCYLDGYYGASTRWGSGWLDLRQPTTFESDTCLHFTIGETASRILIRLLRVDDDPNSAVGFVGGIHDVPDSREVVVKLSRRFANIKQISVHGGPKAFHFDLGHKNGPATLESVKVIPCPNQ